MNITKSEARLFYEEFLMIKEKFSHHKNYLDHIDPFERRVKERGYLLRAIDTPAQRGSGQCLIYCLPDGSKLLFFYDLDRPDRTKVMASDGIENQYTLMRQLRYDTAVNNYEEEGL